MESIHRMLKGLGWLLFIAIIQLMRLVSPSGLLTNDQSFCVLVLFLFLVFGYQYKKE